MNNSSYNFIEEFYKNMKETKENMKPVNIMIIGKSGVGKSTLINNVFREKLAEVGIGEPVTQHIKKISKPDFPVVIYDTKGFELSETNQKNIMIELKNEIEKKYMGKEEEHIHVIWYCINSESHRIEDNEKKWIKEFSESVKVPVIIVLTKSYSKSDANSFKKTIDELNLPVKSIQIVLAEKKIIQFDDEEKTIQAHGLEDLVNITINLLPEFIKNSFINAQKVNLEKKIEAARKCIYGYVTSATTVAASPIPFSDALAIIPIQVTMMCHITTIFGLNLEKSIISAIASAILGTTGTTVIGKTIVANLLKLIPGGGTVVGGLINAGTAATLTSALGESYIQLMKKMIELENEGKKITTEDIVNFMKNKMSKN